jgi:hypothetical protein
MEIFLGKKRLEYRVIIALSALPTHGAWQAERAAK